MTDEILFLSHRIPFPPDRGDKIRSHHILRHLAGLRPVHVGTFADDDRDFAAQGDLAALAQSHCLVRRSRPLILAGLQSLYQRRPVSLPAFASTELAGYIARVLADRPIGTIYAFSGQMGQFIPDSFRGRVIFDFVDVDSAKFDSYAESERGIRHWINAREGRLLSAEEARIARRADTSLFVSPEEADLFSLRLSPGDRAASDIRAIRNGIDSHYFDRAAVTPEAKMLACGGPRLIFAGQMDYAPNHAAALRVIERLLPAIRAALPQATFHVVGRAAGEQLLRHHGQDGVYVWGGVDDIRTYLAAADLALIPLDLARGVQNKVLEAMAMALPVVLTNAAATGVNAVAGQQLLCADDDRDLIAQTLALLSQPERAGAMGAAARRHVVDTLSWEATLAPLEAMLDPLPRAARDAA